MGDPNTINCGVTKNGKQKPKWVLRKEFELPSYFKTGYDDLQVLVDVYNELVMRNKDRRQPLPDSIKIKPVFGFLYNLSNCVGEMDDGDPGNANENIRIPLYIVILLSIGMGYVKTAKRLNPDLLKGQFEEMIRKCSWNLYFANTRRLSDNLFMTRGTTDGGLLQDDLTRDEDKYFDHLFKKENYVIKTSAPENCQKVFDPVIRNLEPFLNQQCQKVEAIIGPLLGRATQQQIHADDDANAESQQDIEPNVREKRILKNLRPLLSDGLWKLMFDFMEKNDLITCNADKHTGIVICTKAQYKRELKRQFSDTETYELVSFKKYQEEIDQIKNQQAAIDKLKQPPVFGKIKLQNTIRPSHRPGVMKLLFKMHKPARADTGLPPARPIVPCPLLATAFIQKCMNKVLLPIMVRMKDIVLDSTQLINLLRCKNLENLVNDDAETDLLVLVTGDIRNMYTTIPLPKIIEAVTIMYNRHAEECGVDNILTCRQLITLLKLCLRDNYVCDRDLQHESSARTRFLYKHKKIQDQVVKHGDKVLKKRKFDWTFTGDCYKQKIGLQMGQYYSVVLANLTASYTR